ncbi:hypothetical protein J2045_001963 [Peteryoungia aggregata LMG 23059]|uniref:Uncharacterized protein n=1 Tax=Peteryoungia aggregata LMG 23059 TaxID=1368425 RepID=A0ABU0G857_9HYPH|nr:hypothetical protein [Peteryoungia aggregata LMG 23059]
MILLWKTMPLKVERHRKCRSISEAIKQPCDLPEVADDSGHSLLHIVRTWPRSKRATLLTSIANTLKTSQQEEAGPCLPLEAVVVV